MATVPTSGTNIRFLSGIPFANDYKNTRWFDTVAEQTTYFSGKPRVHTMVETNFQRIEGYHYIAVNESIDDLWNTNYVMFQNSQYSDKWFYAFVTKLEYKQKKTTHVYFQIDVFQTWKFAMNFKPSYVVREHRPLWQSNGLPVVNTVDEGLHYGSDYETVSVENFVPYGNIFFMVIVAKQTMHGGTEVGKIKPVLNGSPQPLSYYVTPFKMDGTSPKVVQNFGGADGAIEVKVSTISEIMKAMYTHETAVNNIVSIYVTDHIGATITVHPTKEISFNVNRFSHVEIQDANIAGAEGRVSTFYVENVPEYNALTTLIGDKYDGYNNVTESKLLMYPYTVLILDDFRGNRVELKNEFIEGKDLRITTRGSMGTSNKTSYAVTDYLADADVSGTNRLVLSLEKSVINNSPNDVPIITDLLSAYLQGNKNSIENQTDSIVFNGLMSNIGTGIGGISSAMTGNVAGAASSITGMVQGTGNSILQLQGIQAKQQDISNVPPSIAKQGGNTAYEFGNDYRGLYIIKKQVRPEYRKKLTDFFKMYGYKLNEVKVPNFHTRQHWNYVQTNSCNILGNFNHEDLRELKSVFDGGITLWHTDDVGNYALENGVI